MVARMRSIRASASAQLERNSVFSLLLLLLLLEFSRFRRSGSTIMPLRAVYPRFRVAIMHDTFSMYTVDVQSRGYS